MLEGHSVVLYRDDFFIFGGLDHTTGQFSNTTYSVPLKDVTSLNPTVRMTPVICTGTIPPPRAYHSACLRGMFYVVLGGTVEDGAESAAPTGVLEALDELVFYTLNLDSCCWARYYVRSTAPGSSPVPQPRCHASLVCTPDALLLYGGFPQSSRSPDDPQNSLLANHWSVFRLSGNADVGEVPAVGASPMLWGQSIVYAHGCLLVFGGVDFPSAAEVSTLCVYNIEERRWRWAEFPTAPPARALHTAVVDRGFMIVFGGFSTAEQLNPTSSSDLSSFVESPGGEHQKKSDGQTRSSPYAEASSQFCDTWIFSLATGLWTELETAGPLPTHRSGHAACASNGLMFVFAGLEGSNAASEGVSTVAILDIDSRSWTTKRLVVGLQHVSSSPPRDAAHSPLSLSVPRDQSRSLASASPPLAAATSLASAPSSPPKEESRPSIGAPRLLTSISDASTSSDRLAASAVTVKQARALRGKPARGGRESERADNDTELQQLKLIEATRRTVAGDDSAYSSMAAGGMLRSAPIPPVPLQPFMRPMDPHHRALVDRVNSMQRSQENAIRSERSRYQAEQMKTFGSAYESIYPTIGSMMPYYSPATAATMMPSSASPLMPPGRRTSVNRVFGSPPPPNHQTRVTVESTVGADVPLEGNDGVHGLSLRSAVEPWRDLVDLDEDPTRSFIIQKTPSPRRSSSEQRRVTTAAALDADESMPFEAVQLSSPYASSSAAFSAAQHYNPLLPGPFHTASPRWEVDSQAASRKLRL
jgi:hypothetical protein